MNGKYTVISTFAGGGGSSLGYKMAGYKELLAIEWDKNACETLKTNFKFPIWEKDITKVSSKDILDFCNIEKGELDILDGSPPCQGFSTAGKRQVNDDRNNLFMSFIKLIKGLQPKVFIMENVSGMAKGTMKGKFNEIVNALKNTKYNIKCKLMNAKYYNVPQSRERLIFIGTRKDLNLNISFPIPCNKIKTAKNAIKHLENEYKEDLMKYKFIKQGEKIYNYGTSEIRIRKNIPYRTLRKAGGTSGGNRDIHYKKNRRLSIKELKILSSFPENYKLIGTDRQKVDRIGNSVMPNMMKAIALNIKDNILNNYYKNVHNL